MLTIIIISFLVGLVSATIGIYSFIALLISKGYFKIEKSNPKEDPKIITDSELDNIPNKEKTLA